MIKEGTYVESVPGSTQSVLQRSIQLSTSVVSVNHSPRKVERERESAVSAMVEESKEET